MSDWTTYNGEPVYWLAPEFWNPRTGVVSLLLPGESPEVLSSAEMQRRIVEFYKLQGDRRYCSAEMSARMKRLMRERLGSDAPWREADPVNVAEHPEDRMDHPVPEMAQAGIPGF